MIMLWSKVDILAQRLREPGASYNYDPDPRRRSGLLAPLVAIDISVAMDFNRFASYALDEVDDLFSPSELEAKASASDNAIIATSILSLVITVYLYQILIRGQGMPADHAEEVATMYYGLFLFSRMFLLDLEEEYHFSKRQHHLRRHSSVYEYSTDPSVHAHAPPHDDWGTNEQLLANRHRATSLPTRQYSPIHSSPEQGHDCAIYQLECIGEAEWVHALVCRHQFHRHCLKTWIDMCRRTSKCPLCRTPIFGGRLQPTSVRLYRLENE